MEEVYLYFWTGLWSFTKCPKRLYPQNMDAPDQSPGIIICAAQIQHPRKAPRH